MAIQQPCKHLRQKRVERPTHNTKLKLLSRSKEARWEISFGAAADTSHCKSPAGSQEPQRRPLCSHHRLFRRLPRTRPSPPEVFENNHNRPLCHLKKQTIKLGSARCSPPTVRTSPAPTSNKVKLHNLEPRRRRRHRSKSCWKEGRSRRRPLVPGLHRAYAPLCTSCTLHNHSKCEPRNRQNS